MPRERIGLDYASNGLHYITECVFQSTKQEEVTRRVVGRARNAPLDSCGTGRRVECVPSHRYEYEQANGADREVEQAVRLQLGGTPLTCRSPAKLATRPLVVATGGLVTSLATALKMGFC